ncbi:unnamed protein product [Pseudo-nitzschia multistriata]|uniref:Uncharacterized protein n=1 Tax=Pseudo-nitzschia multistriata TaxID=183589 RepID=A0A448Z9Z9_9STRA|nr:unnamed protein product [Pseudo-nitzschia multistriata]
MSNRCWMYLEMDIPSSHSRLDWISCNSGYILSSFNNTTEVWLVITRGLLVSRMVRNRLLWGGKRWLCFCDGFEESALLEARNSSWFGSEWFAKISSPCVVISLNRRSSSSRWGNRCLIKKAKSFMSESSIWFPWSTSFRRFG